MSAPATLSKDQGYRQHHGCTGCDCEKHYSGDRPAPYRARDRVTADNLLAMPAALGVTEAVAEHDQRDGNHNGAIHWQIDNQRGGEKKKSNKAHSGKPFLDNKLGDALKAVAREGIHSLFLSNQERVVWRVGGSGPTRRLFCGGGAQTSTSGALVAERGAA